MAGTIDESRKSLCDIGRRLWERGLVAGHDGNLSVRLSEKEYLCTPTLCSKGALKPDELCVIDEQGRPLGGARRPSSEIRLHMRIYAELPDVQAVVHCHPPHALAFAATGTPLPRNILPEVEVTLGAVPLVPFALPASQALADACAPYLAGHRALLLANHGTVSYGGDLERAYWYTEILEHYCRIVILSRAVGPLQPLAAEALTLLRPPPEGSVKSLLVDPSGQS